MNTTLREAWTAQIAALAAARDQATWAFRKILDIAATLPDVEADAIRRELGSRNIAFAAEQMRHTQEALNHLDRYIAEITRDPFLCGKYESAVKEAREAAALKVHVASFAEPAAEAFISTQGACPTCGESLKRQRAAFSTLDGTDAVFGRHCDNCGQLYKVVMRPYDVVIMRSLDGEG